MKKLLLFAVALFVIGSSFAQERSKSAFGETNIVGVSPGFLIRGLRVKYETPIMEKITIGGTLSGYFLSTSYPGVQVAPFGRYYLKEAGSGFYGQVKVLTGYHTATITNKKFEDEKKGFMAFGAGIGVGWQWIMKNPRWSIDANIGIKFCNQAPTNEADSQDGYSEIVGGIQSINWNTMGPGSVFDGLFSICYRF